MVNAKALKWNEYYGSRDKMSKEERVDKIGYEKEEERKVETPSQCKPTGEFDSLWIKPIPPGEPLTLTICTFPRSEQRCLHRNLSARKPRARFLWSSICLRRMGGW